MPQYQLQIIVGAELKATGPFDAHALAKDFTDCFLIPPEMKITSMSIALVERPPNPMDAINAALTQTNVPTEGDPAADAPIPEVGGTLHPNEPEQEDRDES